MDDCGCDGVDVFVARTKWMIVDVMILMCVLLGPSR